jgi:hypothetical protein
VARPRLDVTGRRSRRAERVYGFLVDLYPKRFRQEFGSSMKQTFLDLLDDPDMTTSRIWLSVFRDVGSSLFREHLANVTGGRVMTRISLSAGFLRVALLVVLIGGTPLASGAAGYYLGRSQVQPVAQASPYPDEATIQAALSRLPEAEWRPLDWIPCQVAIAPGARIETRPYPLTPTVTVFVMNTGGEARCPVLP